MAEFIVLVGPPGCGKTSYRKQYLNNYVCLSSDDLRNEMYGTENLHSNDANIKLFEEMDKRIMRNLKEKKDIVYDATNMTKKYRIDLLRKVKNYPEYTINCLLFATLPSICEDRIYLRSKDIWDVDPRAVSKKILKCFQVPTKEEGFDNIKVIFDNESLTKLKSNEFDILFVISNLLTFNQENHHHTQTLGKHILAVAKKAYDDNQYDLALAALFHDLGKEMTKTFKNRKGIDTEEAHYFEHENISAYLSIFYLHKLGYNINYILYISEIINTHMLSISKLKPKTIEKYGFTSKFINTMELFNEYDRNSRDIDANLDIIPLIIKKTKESE